MTDEDFEREYQKARMVVRKYQEKQDKGIQLQLKDRAIESIGKCYKYRNSYGRNYDGITESWWLYEEILDHDFEDEYSNLLIRTFQKTPLETEIKVKDVIASSFFSMGYEEISREEFDEGIQEVLESIGLELDLAYSSWRAECSFCGKMAHLRLHDMCKECYEKENA